MKEKTQRGITLIALIITIIVMLILAMATISIVLGPNGIIKKASEATEAQEFADAKDKTLDLALGYLDTSTKKIKLGEFAAQYNGIDDTHKINGYAVSNGSYTVGDTYVTLTKEGKKTIYLYENGNITDILQGTPEPGIGEQENEDPITGKTLSTNLDAFSEVLDASGNSLSGNNSTASLTYENSNGETLVVSFHAGTTIQDYYYIAVTYTELNSNVTKYGVCKNNNGYYNEYVSYPYFEDIGMWAMETNEFYMTRNPIYREVSEIPQFEGTWELDTSTTYEGPQCLYNVLVDIN